MNFNPRDMAKAMQRMGIQQKEIEAIEVVIKCSDKDIVIENPQVAKVNMMGHETWQVTGNSVEKPKSSEPDIKEEDVKTVMSQAGCSYDEALSAIKEANGDLAQAILNLTH